jgi:hypothetical protein
MESQSYVGIIRGPRYSLPLSSDQAYGIVTRSQIPHGRPRSQEPNSHIGVMAPDFPVSPVLVYRRLHRHMGGQS